MKIILKKKDVTFFEGDIMELPIRNEEILKKCIELFEDDDPCIIHRSYVINAYILEFYEEIKKAGKNTKTCCSESIDPNILKYLDFNDLKGVKIFYE